MAERRTVGGGDGWWYESLMIPGRSRKLLSCLVVAETWHGKGAGTIEMKMKVLQREKEVETKAGQRVKTCSEVVGPAKDRKINQK